MAFINKIIGPDEKLVGISSIHWMYAAIGIMWMAAFLSLGFYLDSFATQLAFNFPGNPGVLATNIMGHAAFWICTTLGVLLFLLYFLAMVTTEIGLTNKRIIYKHGWIFVKVSEADLEEIKAAGVNNGLFGRFFNYGYIELDARFIKNMNFPAIGDPYRFVKAVNEIRGHLRQDSMTVVLEGHGDAKVADEAVKIKPEAKKSVPKLEDPRYKSISDDPTENIREVAAETREAVSRHSGEPARQMAPHPTTPPPSMPTMTPPVQAAPQQNKAHGPVVFEKTNLKEELKEKIIENFSDITHQKAS
jgi:hypothetical protein